MIVNTIRPLRSCYFRTRFLVLSILVTVFELSDYDLSVWQRCSSHHYLRLQRSMKNKKSATGKRVNPEKCKHPPSKITKKAKKRYRGKKGKKAENPARLPEKDTNQFSSNWEKLRKEIESQPRKKLTKNARINPQEPMNPKPPKIWFDDVDEELLDPEDRPRNKKGPTSSKTGAGLVKEHGFKGLTKILAIDCEMVGVGYKGEDSILARVSVVNHFGHCVYDKFVKPTEKVTNYRTAVSGIRPCNVENATPFKDVQKELSVILQGRILVGHSIKNDLKVLFLDHPRKMIRDTSRYQPFRAAFGGRTPSLKNLSERMLGVKIQDGEHSSVQDAQATMRLYTMFRTEWEKSIKGKKLPLNKSKDEHKNNFTLKVQTETMRPKYQDSDSDN